MNIDINTSIAAISFVAAICVGIYIKIMWDPAEIFNSSLLWKNNFYKFLTKNTKNPSIRIQIVKQYGEVDRGCLFHSLNEIVDFVALCR